MRIIALLFLVFSINNAQAAESDKTNLIAIGQGISAPASTSTINYSAGYTAENPVGTIYQNGVRLTGQYDQNGNDGYGVEIGYGKGDWGIAIGHRARDCEECEGSTEGAVGFTISDVGIGFRFGEGIYSAGVLLNPRGEHRVGVMFELHDGLLDDNDHTDIGVGYSYVASNLTLTVDASKRSYNDSTFNDDLILLTPGLMVTADFLQLSISDRITLNNNIDNNNDNDSGTDHSIWVGIGVGGDEWHAALYVDYVNELALVGSLYF